MAAMQGNGKIRLIAKRGLYADTAAQARLRATQFRVSVPGQPLGPNYLNTVSAAAKERAEAGNYYIEFDATPEITESGSVSYNEISNIRGPASIMVWEGSPSRTFSINAKLIARDTYEADRVARQIFVLKSWRMPESYEGGVAANNPSLLYLQGYGKMFKDIPVVLTDLTIEFPSDRDYITSSIDGYANYDVEELRSKKMLENKILGIKGPPLVPLKDYNTVVPVITQVNITLKEAHGVDAEGLDGLDSFDILKYRTGKLEGW